MNFTIEQSVKDLGVKCLGVIIEGVDNQTITPEYLEYRKKTIQELQKDYQNYDLKSDEIIEGFYLLHEQVHVKRRKNPPASVHLIQYLLKHQDLPSVNKIVDLYNILSVKTRLSLGAHDIEKMKGDVILRLTDGSEKFIPLGMDEAQAVQSGEYSYIDEDNEIICRLEIRQVEKTRVTEESHDVFFIVQGNKNTDDSYIKEVALELIKVITQFCQGHGRIIENERM